MSRERVTALFERAYGRAPHAVASAPGRVNLIGEHTDYNGGAVLPIAIDRRTWVAVAPSGRSRSRAVSDERGRVISFRSSGGERTGRWTDYLVGVLTQLPSRTCWDVSVVSTVPSGAGLSSSAALEVAFAASLSAATGVALDPAMIARVAHRAECDFVGVRCGIMDQTVSACAQADHALLIACDSGQTTQVPFAGAILVVDTVSPRGLRQSAFNERRDACDRALSAIRQLAPQTADLAHATPEAVAAAGMSDVDRRRAQHVVEEHARVAAAVEALENGRSIGHLLLASHQSLRELYECSTAELDWVVEFASHQDGVEGARLTGAGWGGCAIVVGEPGALDAVQSSLPTAYAAAVGRKPRVWLTHAVEGVKGHAAAT